LPFTWNQVLLSQHYANQEFSTCISCSWSFSSKPHRSYFFPECITQYTQQYVFVDIPEHFTKSYPALLQTQPALLATLGNATNITVLAPSNEALADFLNSSAGTAAAGIPSAVEALLTYHVLNGTYPASAFTNTSQFIPTLLTNSSYANVTGGQRVEAVFNGTNVEIFSGLLQKSTVITAVSFVDRILISSFCN
jgi:uncharacterized surface protein with fasciclin (FAS1) repeats